MFTLIKKWLNQRAQRKAYKKIKEELLSNESLMIQTKDAFEKAFGTNNISRTKAQWVRLVNVYGIEVVAQTEGMSTDQIKAHCNESFSNKVKRVLK